MSIYDAKWTNSICWEYKVGTDGRSDNKRLRERSYSLVFFFIIIIFSLFLSLCWHFIFFYYYLYLSLALWYKYSSVKNTEREMSFNFSSFLISECLDVLPLVLLLLPVLSEPETFILVDDNEDEKTVCYSTRFRAVLTLFCYSINSVLLTNTVMTNITCTVMGGQKLKIKSPFFNQYDLQLKCRENF